MKVQMIFKWFDFWIGIFYDQKKNWIYLLPIPMVGIIFKLPENWRISSVVVRFRSIAANYRDQRKFLSQKRKLETVFKELNWSHDDVMEMTRWSCGCLDDAVGLLSRKLIQEAGVTHYRLNQTARHLVIGGFDRKWK